MLSYTGCDDVESIYYYAFCKAISGKDEHMITKCSKYITIDYLITYNELEMFDIWCTTVIKQFGIKYYMTLVSKYIMKQENKQCIPEIILSHLNKTEINQLYTFLLEKSLLIGKNENITYFYNKLNSYQKVVEQTIYDHIDDEKYVLFLNKLQPLKLHTANTNIALFKCIFTAHQLDIQRIKDIIFNLLSKSNSIYNKKYQDQDQVLFNCLTSCFPKVMNLLFYCNKSILPDELWLVILDYYWLTTMIDLVEINMDCIHETFKYKEIRTPVINNLRNTYNLFDYF